MLLLNNYKHYLVILLITVVLGYFLGITVSTVVDYRLKDAVINLPKPKNKILVNLNDSDVLETFKNSKKKSKSKKAKKSKDKSEEKTKKTKKTKKSKKSKKTKKEPFIEAFTSKMVDINLKEYENNFKKSEKNKKVLEFKAANEEDNEQNYQQIS
jgi:hypothetical protein